MAEWLDDEDREAVRQMAYAGSYSQEKAARYVTTVEGIVARKVAEALREAAIEGPLHFAATHTGRDARGWNVVEADWLRDRAERLRPEPTPQADAAALARVLAQADEVVAEWETKGPTSLAVARAVEAIYAFRAALVDPDQAGGEGR